MSGEEINTCPECGKSIQEKRGSITQWIGLGDSCKCDQQDVGSTGQTQRRAGKTVKKCRRCLKPIGSNQSMTQWMFKKETCKCPAEADPAGSTDYTQKAMSSRRLHSTTTGEENKAPIALLVGGVLLFILVCGYAILETSGILNLRNPVISRHKGSQRVLNFFGPEYLACHPPTSEKEWHASAIQSATRLTIRDSTLDDELLEQISSHARVDTMVFRNCDGITVKGVKALQKCRSLVNLSFESSKIDSDILTAVAVLNLETLDLSFTEIALEDWSVLLYNQNLRNLNVFGVSISRSNRNAFIAAGFNAYPKHFERVTYTEPRPRKQLFDPAR